MATSEPTAAPTARECLATIVAALRGSDLPVDFTDEQTVVTELPGEHKLRTTVAMSVGEHSVAINAFVARAPQENHEAMYRWMLERNRRLNMIAYALDPLGDIYLTGRLPLVAVTAETVDHLLGAVLSSADGDFDHLVAMGFESSIRAEWRWRLDRGESTRNLQAFAHLAPEADHAARFSHER